MSNKKINPILTLKRAKTTELNRSINVQMPNELLRRVDEKREEYQLVGDRAGWSKTINIILRKRIINLGVRNIERDLVKKIRGVQTGKNTTIYLDDLAHREISRVHSEFTDLLRPVQPLPWAWVVIAVIATSLDIKAEQLVDKEEVELPKAFIMLPHEALRYFNL